MYTPLRDQLTKRFYEWEKRGRGLSGWQFPVELEPEYYPFFGHFGHTQPVKDDSKRHTLVSGLISLFTPKDKPQPDTIEYLEIPPTRAYPSKCEDLPMAYSVILPKGEKIEMEDMEQLLLMISYTEEPVSFEIVATGEVIRLQYACREIDAALVYGQMKAYFPMAVITKDDKCLDLLLQEGETIIVDFALREEFMRPLVMADKAAQDPYIGLFGMLGQLNAGECGVVQVLFKGTTNPWSESIMRSVMDNMGGSFFEDDPDMVKLAKEKVSAPLFAVCIRAIGQGKTSEKALDIVKGIANAVMRATDSTGNSLGLFMEEEYTMDMKLDDVYLRESHRAGMLLNSRELATIAHFPTDEVRSAKLERESKKTKAAPASAHGHKFVLGTNSHHGSDNIVSVPTSLRLKHTHILGATGTGKSTLFLSMVAQDMEQGNGLAVLDPHGDLIEAILARVPKERINDVILIDPSDGEYPVAFNILSAHSEVEKDILSSDLVAAFKRLSTSWGDQMNSVFANAILAFLESTEGGTLADLRRFLIEKPYRDKYLNNVKDPHIVYYWEHEYPLLKSSSLGSILTRLDTFLRPKLIRNMVAQRKGLDFEHIMDSKKILLVKLSQGLIGAENSFLLGTFFVSKIYQAAMARQSKSDRKDFFFYIDEFHHFATPSMSHILSGARKYHLGLILAHQDMQQLQKYDTELASSVVVNAGTRICFRLGDIDAKRFASGFSYFDATDLENLNTGEAIARIEQPNFDFNLSTIPLPALEADEAENITKAVVARSREQYGTPREYVEKSLEHTEKIVPVQEAVQKESAQESTPKSRPAPAPFVPVEIPKKPAPAKKVETQHRYLQTLIKKMAESRGYKAMIEEPTPDGKGRVDVSLERNGKRIACEVSVTTDDTWEIHNVEKCLSAGYEQVIVCSNDKKNLERIRSQVASKLNADHQARVLMLESDDVIQFFDKQIVQESSTEKVMKGYKVKVEYEVSTPEEMKAKHGHVVKAVTDSIRKKK